MNLADWRKYKNDHKALFEQRPDIEAFFDRVYEFQEEISDLQIRIDDEVKRASQAEDLKRKYTILSSAYKSLLENYINLEDDLRVNTSPPKEFQNCDIVWRTQTEILRLKRMFVENLSRLCEQVYRGVSRSEEVQGLKDFTSAEELSKKERDWVIRFNNAFETDWSAFVKSINQNQI